MECIRLQTLNRQALQQIQVDVHFLRPQLRRSSAPPFMAGGIGSIACCSPSAIIPALHCSLSEAPSEINKRTCLSQRCGSART